MRIKVIHDKEANWLKIPVTLKTPHKIISTFIVFDTGSHNTLLNYLDSRRLNIPFIELSSPAKIGGNKYQSYSYNNVEFSFKTIQGSVIKEEMPVKILRPSLNSRELKELDDLPNILGLEFLKLGYKFYCDLKNNEIYFEKE